MEKDDEVKGSGNWLQFGDFGYDPRTGMRINRDPIRLPWQSPYSTFNNNPILYADPDGLFANKRRAERYAKTVSDASEGISAQAFKNDNPTKRGNRWGVNIGYSETPYHGLKVDGVAVNFAYETVYSAGFLGNIENWLNLQNDKLYEWDAPKRNIQAIGYGLDLKGEASVTALGTESLSGAIVNQSKVYSGGQDEQVQLGAVNNTYIEGSIDGKLNDKSLDFAQQPKIKGEAFAYLFFSNQPNQKTTLKARSEKQFSLKIIDFKLTYSKSSSGKKELKLGFTNDAGFEMKYSNKIKVGLLGIGGNIDVK
jgi:hypothetical protein